MRHALLAIAGCTALAVVLAATPPPEPHVEMAFVKTPLAEVVELYEALVGKPVQVSEDFRDRPVSINSRGKISRNEALKMIESRLGNYDIQIVERNGVLVALGPKRSSSTANAQSPHLLYVGLDSLSGEELKAQLQDITSASHKPLGYAMTKDVLMAIDEDPANTNNVITLYERKSVPKSKYFKGDPDVAWDREHVLPQPYGAIDGRFAKSDLHNLFPSLKEINSLRSSLYFDESDDSEEKPAKAPLASHDADSWEPPNEIKGDIARVVFYMDTRYDGSDSAQDIKLAEVPNRKKQLFGNLRVLLDWHKSDPVSHQERERNREIWKAQGNRNPFVDRPDLVEKVYEKDSVASGSSKSVRELGSTVSGPFKFRGEGRLDSRSGKNSFHLELKSKDDWGGIETIDTPPRTNWLYKLWPDK